MQTSENKIKTFDDFFNPLMPKYMHHKEGVDHVDMDSLTKEAGRLFGEYVFRLGCRAQHIKDFMEFEIIESGKEPSIEDVQKRSQQIEFANNPFSLSQKEK